MRLRTGGGTKGIRHYDWSMPAITSDDAPDGQHEGHSALPVRRHRYTGTLSFYRCWSPEPVPLSRLIFVACARWRIEEDHQLVKHICGLDKGQVIRWRSWHRWSAMCLLAYVLLAVALARRRLLDGDLPQTLELAPSPCPDSGVNCATSSSRPPQ
jgi:SRSO17 transposase